MKTIPDQLKIRLTSRRTNNDDGSITYKPQLLIDDHDITRHVLKHGFSITADTDLTGRFLVTLVLKPDILDVDLPQDLTMLIASLMATTPSDDTEGDDVE